jgi:two-component system copper resistance phosphate regulon response regulator CusR
MRKWRRILHFPYIFLTQILHFPYIWLLYAQRDILPARIEQQDFYRAMVPVFRILVVEDDPKLGDSIVARLRSGGYEATHAKTGEDAFFLILTTHPDLVILDLTLPQRGGLEILTQVRTQGLDVRVIILTSHNTVEDRVAGLAAGADDYLGKPFSFPELLARVSALLRRTASKVTSGTLQLADLIIDQKARIVTRGATRLELTTREYDLLLYLFGHRNSPVSREMLVKDVWHEASRSTPIDNIVNVQVTRLRRKIDDPFPVKLLHTIHGVGFVLREPQA